MVASVPPLRNPTEADIPRSRLWFFSSFRLFPSLKRRGGCASNNLRSHRSGADGVVSSAKPTTPSAPFKVASQHLFNVAASPPFQGGEKSPLPKVLAYSRCDSVRLKYSPVRRDTTGPGRDHRSRTADSRGRHRPCDGQRHCPIPRYADVSRWMY